MSGACRPSIPSAAAAIVLGVVALAVGCGGGGLRPEPIPLPEPDLAAVEPVVRAQLLEARKRVDDLVATAGSDAESRAELAEAYRDLGRRYQVQDLGVAAEACYRNVLVLEPDDFETLYHLGIVLHENGRQEEAIATYMRARELRPDYVPVSIRLGEVWLRREPERARAYFEAALDDDAYRAAAHYGLGRVEAAAKNHEAAAHHFEAALALQPGASRVHYSLGLAYRALGRRDEAESQLASYGQVDVAFPDPVLGVLREVATGAAAHAKAARSAMLREQYAAAAREYRLVVDAEPDDPEARRAYGKALWSIGDLAGSIEQYRAAVRLEPDNPNALFSLGRVLTEGGLDDEAIPVLRSALELDPRFSEARVNLARALAGVGSYDEAIAEFRELLEDDPESRASRLGEAEVRRREGRYDLAASLLRAMIDADPQDVEARIELARVHSEAGRIPEAIATLREAEALEPDRGLLTLVLHNLGVARARVGERPRAIESFRRALEIDPGLSDTRFQLATVLARSGRFSEAADEFAQVVEARPRDLRAVLAGATSLVLAERYAEALAALESGVETFPGQPDLAVALAKLLATCPAPGVRDGERALRIALAAWEHRAGLEEAEVVAMSYAEIGSWDEAVHWQRELVSRAEELDRPDLVSMFRGNLSRYERSEPSRAPWKAGS